MYLTPCTDHRKALDSRVFTGKVESTVEIPIVGRRGWDVILAEYMLKPKGVKSAEPVLNRMPPL
jgi:hypothetical protein